MEVELPDDKLLHVGERRDGVIDASTVASLHTHDESKRVAGKLSELAQVAAHSVGHAVHLVVLPHQRVVGVHHLQGDHRVGSHVSARAHELERVVQLCTVRVGRGLRVGKAFREVVVAGDCAHELNKVRLGLAAKLASAHADHARHRADGDAVEADLLHLGVLAIAHVLVALAALGGRRLHLLIRVRIGVRIEVVRIVVLVLGVLGVVVGVGARLHVLLEDGAQARHCLIAGNHELLARLVDAHDLV